MWIHLGTPVECADGSLGTIGDVVIDAARRAVTHIVVEPHRRHHLARLVPFSDLDVAPNGAPPRLRCTAAEIVHYPQVAETAFIRLGEWPPVADQWDVGVSAVRALPVDSGFSAGPVRGPAWGADQMLIAYDRIPAGEVELRRGSAVEAADGRAIGRVEGLLTDADGRVTHLVLERGHLWRRREVSLPVSIVKRIRTDAVDVDPAEELDAPRLRSVPRRSSGE